jgi:hypothetical protein
MMQEVKINTPAVTIELKADETSIDDLSRKALELFRDASDVNSQVASGPAVGFSAERRGTVDHHSRFRPVAS